MLDAPPDRVVRFNWSERAIHWLVAFAFFLMLGSGLFMGHRGSLHNALYVVHLSAAGLLVIGVTAIVMRGDRKALSRTGRQLRNLDHLDRAWLASVGTTPFRHSARPPAGRFNAGQKVNFILITMLFTALLISGIGLIIGSSLFGAAKAAHVVAAYLSVILVVGHLYMALINPSTRPALSGMISGMVDGRWLRQHHARASDDDSV